MTLKLTKYTFFIFLIASLALSTSCRKEEMELIQEPPEETLNPNSSAGTVIKRTAMNDGSNDNIIDYANCFNIQLPVTVVANGTEVNVVSTSDYQTIENIFETYDDDVDSIEIQFPIIIILADFSEITINSITELNTYSNNCTGENVDDDIECIDFQYPVSAAIFNTNNELLATITLNSDQEMFTFVQNIDVNEIVSLDFPITLAISDGTTFSINSLSELETTIVNYIYDCDEDDDFDYNDDDCNNCNPFELIDLLISCPDWRVDKLERNDHDYDEVYEGYLFNFYDGGAIEVSWDLTTVYGTWSATGTGNDITVSIDIPSLPYCNLDWRLHEIEIGSSETKIDLREGDDDRLRYYNTCN